MKTRIFEDIWRDIKKLQNKDVFTLRRHQKNHIVGVDETGLRTIRGKSDFPYPITKGAFETVWRKLITNDRYIPVEDGGYHIICACIALISEVEYSLKPVTIWLSEKRHEFGKLSEKTQ
jgi:hypothetical protein